MKLYVAPGLVLAGVAILFTGAVMPNPFPLVVVGFFTVVAGMLLVEREEQRAERRADEALYPEWERRDL